MNKFIRIIKMIISIIVAVFLAVAGVIIGKDKSPYQSLNPVIAAIIFVVIGLIGGYLTHNLLHEVMHALFAKSAGAKIFEIAFWGFVFSGSGISFDFKSGVAGWTAFVVKNPEKTKRVFDSSLLGGFVGTASSFSIGVVLWGLSVINYNFYLVTLSSGFLAINLYLASLNFFTLLPGTDGRMISKPHGYHTIDYFDNLLNLEYHSRMFLGESASEICELSTQTFMNNERFIVTYDIEKSLSDGQIETAFDQVNMGLNSRNNDDSGFLDLLFERFFIFILKKDDEHIRHEEQFFMSLLLAPATAKEYRIAIYYRRYKGETEWADSLEQTFYHQVYSCPLKGYGKTQLEIYNKYLEKQ